MISFLKIVHRNCQRYWRNRTALVRRNMAASRQLWTPSPVVITRRSNPLSSNNKMFIFDRIIPHIFSRASRPTPIDDLSLLKRVRLPSAQESFIIPLLTAPFFRNLILSTHLVIWKLPRNSSPPPSSRTMTGSLLTLSTHISALFVFLA